MTPVKQRNRHDPENGVFGDCDRAAVASVLDAPLDDIPFFYDGLHRGSSAEETDLAHNTRRRWFRRNDIRLIQMALKMNSAEELIGAISLHNPGQHFLLVGESRNGTGHVVVCRDGRIVHDPALDESGIVGPEPRSGCYWVEFLVKESAPAARDPAGEGPS